MTVNVKKLEKMAKNIKNMLKFVMLKYCKTFQLMQKLIRNLFSNPRESSLDLKSKNSKVRQKNSKNLKKASFIKKIAKICDMKKLKNPSPTTKNSLVTYYQTP